MNTISGNVLQRNISKVFPSKLTSSIAEIIFLFLMGTLAMLIHAKLRIPMHLPGKSGLLFMIIVISARASSRFSFGSSMACLGAAFVLLISNLGFDDPFMPVVYVLLGIVMDFLFGLATIVKPNVMLIGLAAGLSWMFIPLIRAVVSLITGFPYESLLGGMAYPLITHFIFGLSGGLIGAGLVYWAGKSQK